MGFGIIIKIENKVKSCFILFSILNEKQFPLKMKYFLIFISIANLLISICCSSEAQMLHRIENFRDRSSIWWRYNSFYNEALVKWLKRKHQIEERLKEKEQERLNLNLIENLLKKAQATLLHNSLETKLTLKK